MKTLYVVLWQKTVGGSWELVGSEPARNAEAACRVVAQARLEKLPPQSELAGLQVAGMYVGIPDSSFRPIYVGAELQTKLTFGSPGEAGIVPFVPGHTDGEDA